MTITSQVELTACSDQIIKGLHHEMAEKWNPPLRIELARVGETGKWKTPPLRIELAELAETEKWKTPPLRIELVWVGAEKWTPPFKSWVSLS